MPWNIPDLMSHRFEFVLLAKQEGINFRELCRRFGIAPKTGYKWCRRFRDGGRAALEDLSRRPHASPLLTAPDLAALVVALRLKHPTWGGYKLQQHLLLQGYTPPAASTCTEIARRAGLVRRQETHYGPYCSFERGLPNELWQMDYKGHFGTQSGERCHPLTLLDDHSRFNLVLAAHRDERGATVQAELTDAFTLYGLPDGILCDNGSPWGYGDATCPYTSFAVWLLRLGVRVLHGRPYHPQTQGKDERFHRTLNHDLISQHTWRDLEHCRTLFAAYRDVYNCERPHEELDGAPPISRYRPSVRAMPTLLPPIEYAPGTQVRILRETGLVTFGSQTWYVGRAFGGLPIGLRPDDDRDGHWNVYFCQHLIGHIDLTGPRSAKHSARSIYEHGGEADRLPCTPSAQSR